MALTFGMNGTASVAHGKDAQVGKSVTAQIQALQKQLGQIQKQLKDLLGVTNPTSAQRDLIMQLNKQVAAIEAEIKALQQASALKAAEAKQAAAAEPAAKTVASLAYKSPQAYRGVGIIAGAAAAAVAGRDDHADDVGAVAAASGTGTLIDTQA